jgi:hypothetical protein
MAITSSAADASKLCADCGLCCNGVLFSDAKAESHEVSALKADGLVVEQVGDRQVFRQPCLHHCGRGCAIYPRRPERCRTFRCALLKRFEAGEVTRAEAVDTILRAKAMIDKVATVDPQLALLKHRLTRRLKEARQPGMATRLWLESLALDIFLDRTFRNKPVVEFQPDLKRCAQSKRASGLSEG